MGRRSNISAGLLLFRRSSHALELFLAHPGGPFWARREQGAWTIPKGGIYDGEDPMQAAQREFLEETGVRPQGPFLPLGSVRQRAGKLIHAWAWEGDADPATVKSNEVRCEWPRRSQQWIIVPEIDRCSWFSPGMARTLINPAQAELIDRLEEILARNAADKPE